MKRFILSLAAVATSISTSSASAQSAETKSWGTIQNYARCLVDNWSGIVQEITNVFPASKEYKAAIAPISKSACVDNAELTVPAELVRGSLYQALYVKSYPNKAPALAAAQLNLDGDVRGQQEARATPFIVLRRYGECVVRTDPESSRALTLSVSGSKAEDAAFAALQPTLNFCLTQGNSVSFSRAVLTGIIAEVLYRLSVPSWR